jgi:hypothetical protein
MVDRDHDDVAFLDQPRAVVDVARAGAGREAAAVKPHHHRPLAAVAERGSPHVQEEQVFARRPRIRP